MQQKQGRVNELLDGKIRGFIKDQMLLRARKATIAYIRKGDDA